MNEDFKSPGAYEKLAVSSIAVRLTNANIMVGHETMAVITVQGDAIMWRADGSDPTATDGMPIAAGDTYSIAGKLVLDQFKMIRVTGDATVHVHYMHQM